MLLGSELASFAKSFAESGLGLLKVGYEAQVDWWNVAHHGWCYCVRDTNFCMTADRKCTNFEPFPSITMLKKGNQSKQLMSYL